MDTGRTAQRLTGAMLTDGAASVRLATLLDKPARRVVDVIPDYVGFEARRPASAVAVVWFGRKLIHRYRANAAAQAALLWGLATTLTAVSSSMEGTLLTLCVETFGVVAVAHAPAALQTLGLPWVSYHDSQSCIQGKSHFMLVMAEF